MTIATGQNIDPDDFINESEADATPANDAGKVPQLESNGKLSDVFLNASFVKKLNVYQSLDGSTTPVAVTVTANGSAVGADQDEATYDLFYGFLIEDATSAVARYIGGTDGSTVSTYSHTVQAGDDRLVVVAVANDATSGPTAVSWNGNAMTKSVEHSQDESSKDMTVQLWTYAAGDNVSSDTGNVVITGSFKYSYALNYANVHQTTPVANTATAGGEQQDSPFTVAPALDDDAGLIVFIASTQNDLTIPTDANNRFEDQNWTYGVRTADTICGDYDRKAGNESDSFSTNDAQATALANAVAVMSLNAASVTTFKIQTGGVLDGFSGLTPGAYVYLSATEGAITSSDPGNSIIVGKAISATEIVITH